MAVLLGLVASIAAVTSGADVAPATRRVRAGDNLALHKPYRFSVAPCRIWQSAVTSATKRLPDYWSLLTDGQRVEGEGDSALNYHASPRGVSFADVNSVEITIDLGAVYPIQEIYNFHPSRPAAGIPQPKREVYYVSEDGRSFYEAGQYNNQKDPPSFASDAQRSGFYQGLQRFTSGPIRTKARYVMVKTFSYGGVTSELRPILFDEIYVIAGDFDPAQVQYLAKPAFIKGPLVLAREHLGYEIHQSDWKEVWENNPLWYALLPYSYFGESQVALERGATEILTLRAETQTLGKITNVKLMCWLPAALKVVGASVACKPEQQPAERDGEAGTLCIFPVNTAIGDGLGTPFLMVQVPQDLPEGNVGRMEMNWTYDLDGQPKSSQMQRFDLMVTPPIEGATPKRFGTGVWLQYMLRNLPDRSADLEQLLSRYHRLGFAQVWGQNGDWVFHAAEKAGMTATTDTGLMNNGLDFDLFNAYGQRDWVTPERRFQRHPKLTAKVPDYALCPEVAASAEFYPVLVEAAKHALARTHDIYENWEPYMYSKQGCACDRCRKAFQQFAKLSDEEMARVWPDVILDRETTVYNRFNSQQMARVVLTCQRAVQEAGQSLGRSEANFVPAITPDYFDPEHTWHRWHDPADYVQGLNRLIVWAYPYAFHAMSFDPTDRVGRNHEILNSWRYVDAGLKAKGKSMQQMAWILMAEDQSVRYSAMPKDMSYHSLLAFVCGMKGYATYGALPHSTTLLRELAKAHRQIVLYEDTVFDGKVLENVTAKVVSPVPAIDPGANAYRTIIFARAWTQPKSPGTQLIAVGNDYMDRIYATVQVNLSEQGGEFRLVDRFNRRVYAAEGEKGFTPDALRRGVLLPIDSKSWLFVELTTQPAPEGFQVIPAAAVQSDLDRQRPQLQSFADGVR